MWLHYQWVSLLYQAGLENLDKQNSAVLSILNRMPVIWNRCQISWCRQESKWNRLYKRNEINDMRKKYEFFVTIDRHRNYIHQWSFAACWTLHPQRPWRKRRLRNPRCFLTCNSNVSVFENLKLSTCDLNADSNNRLLSAKLYHELIKENGHDKFKDTHSWVRGIDPRSKGDRLRLPVENIWWMWGPVWWNCNASKSRANGSHRARPSQQRPLSRGNSQPIRCVPQWISSVCHCHRCNTARQWWCWRESSTRRTQSHSIWLDSGPLDDVANIRPISSQMSSYLYKILWQTSVTSINVL